MGLSPIDLFRGLPAVAVSGKYSVADDVVTIYEAGGVVRIHYSEQEARKMGALLLPVTILTFTFCDLTDSEIKEFMRRFDLCFRRGGG